MPNFLRNIFFLIVIFLSACSDGGDKKATGEETATAQTGGIDRGANKRSTSNADFGYYKSDGDSLIIPSFEIDVHLSRNAKAKLSKDNETMIVSASFMGVPKDTTSAAYRNSSEMGIAGKDVEIRNGGIAKFENIKFSKALYDSLSDKDIQLLINVFSGRRSSTDNLLNCGIIQEKMSEIRGKKFTIDCKLIYGED